MGQVMSSSRITQMTWVGIIVMNTIIWYSIFTNGFFLTITWLIILAALTGIIIKLKENR